MTGQHMRLNIFLPLAIVCAVAIAAAQTQEVRVVTSDTQVMGGGRAGGAGLAGAAPMAGGTCIVFGKTKLAMVNQDSTDDRGTYRISGLEPGDYVVVVPVQAGGGDMGMGAAMGAMREVMAVRAVSASSDAMPTLLNGLMMTPSASAG